MFKTGDLCKHFKGKNLSSKNIYEILAMQNYRQKNKNYMVKFVE